MSEHEPSEKNPQASPRGVNVTRAVKIAVVLAGLILLAIAIAAILTDGSPHVPFDYGEFN